MIPQFAILFLFLLSCVVYRKIMFSRKYKLPPLANGSRFIFGHTFSILVDAYKVYDLLVNDVIRDALKKGLDAVTMRIGAWKVFLIFDVDDGMNIVNSCLTKDDMIYSFFKPWFGDEGLLVAKEKIWRRHRRIIGPTFNQKILDGFMIEMNKNSRLLVQEMTLFVGKGEFDHNGIFKKFTLNTICATALGASMDDEDVSIKETYISDVEEFGKGMLERSQKFWLHSNFVFNMSSLKKKQDALALKLKTVSEKVINKRRKLLAAQPTLEDGSPRPKAFLDVLLNLEGSLSLSEIREEVDSFVAAGADTTSAALVVILLIIGSYPEVQQRIYDEIKQIFGDSKRDVEKEDLKQLTYMEAVIKETMRLYPLVLSTGRIVEKDLVLKNYTIPSGSRCYVSFYSILRSGSWGADAERFAPERWRRPGGVPPAGAAAMFGMGKRICIGMHYSMSLMKISLCHLLRHFTVAGDITRMSCKIDIVIKPTAGHHISVKYRE